MALSPGQRLGPCDVVTPVGAGSLSVPGDVRPPCIEHRDHADIGLATPE